MEPKFVKKSQFHFLFAALFVFICFGCEESLLVIEEEDASPKESNTTRGLSYNEPSTSNPYLHTDWENIREIYLNNGQSTDSPWIIKEGSPNDIPVEYAADIKKEDGWYLLSHTMIKINTADPNYIIFYNRNRGLLKVFYFNYSPIKNKSLVWTIEANTPSSILPANQLFQGVLNSTNKYATTSNVINQSSANFGQLNMGWNMFTMELPYGETNNNPILSIRAYNSETSEIKLTGEFAGEITVKLPKESSSQIPSIVSSIEKIPGVKKIPGFSTVSGAVSFLGKLGSSSLFTSKKGETIVKGTTAGTIELTGTSFSQYGGAVSALTNINIKTINDGIPLGLWTLKTTPNYRYNEYNLATPTYQTKYSSYFNAEVNMYFDTPNYSGIDKLIEINPSVKSSISSFRVKNVSLFTTASPNYKFSQISTNIYDLETSGAGPFRIVASGIVNHQLPYYNVIVVVQRTLYHQCYASITVEFTYSDGSKFESTKSFKVSTTPSRDNLRHIEDMIKNYEEVVYTD